MKKTKGTNAKPAKAPKKNKAATPIHAPYAPEDGPENQTPVSKPPELGLKGKGAEPLVIEEIDVELERYLAAKKKRVDQQEIERGALTKLNDAMHEHREELLQEVGGGVSYRYGDHVVKLAPGGEKLTVKEIHDKPSQEAGD